MSVWRRPLPRAMMLSVEPAFDDRDVEAILGGVFDMNVRLDRIASDVHTIRLILEAGNEEEEEDEGGLPDA